MRYLKKYEDLENSELTIGDYVYVKRGYPIGRKINYDTKYKILSIGMTGDNRKTAEIEDMNGINIGTWFLKRFISESEYDANKYNL